MEIILGHKYDPKQYIEKKINIGPESRLSFLLTNKIGGFFSVPFSGALLSKFQGMFFCHPESEGWELFKAIENIIPDEKPNKIVNSFCCIERFGEKLKEKFFVPYFYECLVYQTNTPFELLLDMRHVHDFHIFGRNYHVYEQEGCLVFEYTKFREHNSEGAPYKIYMVLAGDDLSRTDIKDFVPTQYKYDKERGSNPSDWWVYKAAKFNVKKESTFVFACSHDIEKAINNAKYVKSNLQYLEHTQKRHIEQLLDTKLRIDDTETALAYKCALKSLDDLTVKIKGKNGIYAGLWWFFQWWTRDEAQSIKALLLEEKYQEAEDILMREIELILPDGRIPNRYPHSLLGSADGVGWAFKRIDDYLKIVQAKHIMEANISPADLLFIQNQLSLSLTKLEKHHTKKGLASNSAMETWMDTTAPFSNDVREDRRIEIQALRLSMYKLMKNLSEATNNYKQFKEHEEKERTLRSFVRQKFWNGTRLADGIYDKNGADTADETIRPNIFIAAYVYPELLSTEEWSRAFDYILPKLWCDWGNGLAGVATIDKSSDLFQPDYKGEANISYHRGDSWYYLNNLIALVLHRTDRDKYKTQINMLLKSSTDQLLYSGIISHLAELSSASKMESAGNLAQAWSVAFYIELINELYIR
jgi:predicted glycogen debranching enzyme